jgi:hypothetical protein
MGMYAHIAYLKGRRNVDMRKEAERLGLRVGKKIKHIRRRVNGEDNDYISKGKVEGLYPHIFTVRMEAGYVVSFRYNEILGKESEGRVTLV